MWKVIAGIAIVALAAFFLLGHEGGPGNDQAVKQSKPASLSGVPADGENTSSAARQNAESDDAVQPRFTSYETTRARRITKSTTGTVVVFPGGRRSPPK